MGVIGAAIRKTRRLRRRYAVTITMRTFLENRQFDTTSNSSKSLPHHPMRGITPDLGDETREDDMYLFDTPPQQPPTLDPDHEFMKIKDPITTFVLKQFLEFRIASDSKKGGRSWSKMRRWSDDKVEDEEMVVNAETPIPIQRHYACPFYIYNPEKHLTCLTRVNLVEIKDIKQHLWNAHRLLPYCPTCGETFTTTGNSDIHIRRRSCSPRGIPRPEGISLQQMQQLARRAEAWMSEDLQWLSIWEIVFPGAELPDFTHPSRTVESIVCQFQDYWSSHGEKVISDFLEEKGFAAYKLPDEEQNLVALRSIILDQVIDRLVESFEHDNDSTISTKTEKVLASL
ncbi:uncharacterized protein GGS22DRAFT_162879 [Annulohypoxylon maeteangense]|uniref:uncharacterized protein n=1 Tax=Annulohypoxylon maeteangense TaxID=1927788 RepID=UPI002007C5A7|nr:uncharacterized protein GGS22DRAFT_162879 [Annulohypoxylon maeteangense]KAI0885144.1 hypothetical protein GGS22DRAFT_162879 [Annulohypoxylon maeteangense]